MGAAIETSARGRVVRVLETAARRFPSLNPVDLDTTGLSSRDASLALAVCRTCLQRWMTVEHVVATRLRRPIDKLEPALRAVLLCAGTQLLFFDRLPTHAVVHEAVEQAKHMVRPGAAGLTNAVLRAVAKLRVATHRDGDRTPAADRIPTEYGCVQVNLPILPSPQDTAAYLSVATSHPPRLVRRWIERFGRDQSTAFCLHNIKTPPIFVGAECPLKPWQGTYAQLLDYLAADPLRRVQDPSAAAAVAATAGLRPARIIDYCAGRGTKTRQLLATHRGAQVFATDANSKRLDLLERDLPQLATLEVCTAARCPGDADLLMLDVPCSNTGVLARRPEARYRFTGASLGKLVDLQRRIAEQAVPLLRPNGHLLYSTCSIEQQENQDQVSWFSSRFGFETVDTQATIPGGTELDYHDGGFFALMRRPKKS